MTHEQVIQVGTDVGQAPAFNVVFVRLRQADSLQDLPGFIRCADTVNLLKRVEVDGKRIETILRAGFYFVGVLPEGGESLSIQPDCHIVGVEYVRTVAMHVDVFDLFRVDIAAQMRPLLDDQAGLAMLSALLGEDRAK